MFSLLHCTGLLCAACHGQCRHGKQSSNSSMIRYQDPCLQFDSSQMEGNISEVRISTLQLKAELSKHSQRVQALTQRLETLERRPLARTMTRKESLAPASSMTRAPSNALPSAGASSPRPRSQASLLPGTTTGTTAEAATTAADSTLAVAAPRTASQPPSSPAGPSVNFAADSKSVESSSTPSVRAGMGTINTGPCPTSQLVCSKAASCCLT